MKAGQRIFDYYKSLPSWAQGVVVVGGLAAVYFAGRGIIKKIKSQADLLKERETLKSVSSDLKKLISQGIKKSYSDSQYKTWSDQIEKQFSGCDWDEGLFKVNVPVIGGWSGSGAKMYNILSQQKNDADFLALQEAYGIRKYDQCGPRIFGISGDFEGSLPQAVADELQEEEITVINKMLTGKKINYQF